jgi:hypothetical protein
VAAFRRAELTAGTSPTAPKIAVSARVQGKMSGVSWSRYQGRAPAAVALTGAARDAELEDFLRLQKPHLTDIRLEQATATEDYETDTGPPRRWYNVSYLADDGLGHTAEH